MDSHVFHLRNVENVRIEGSRAESAGTFMGGINLRNVILRNNVFNRRGGTATTDRYGFAPSASSSHIIIDGNILTGDIAYSAFNIHEGVDDLVVSNNTVNVPLATNVVGIDIRSRAYRQTYVNNIFHCSTGNGDAVFVDGPINPQALLTFVGNVFLGDGCAKANLRGSGVQWINNVIPNEVSSRGKQQFTPESLSCWPSVKPATAVGYSQEGAICQLGRLPAWSIVRAVRVYVDTVCNAGTQNDVRVGSVATVNLLAGLTAVGAVGWKTPAAGATTTFLAGAAGILNPPYYVGGTGVDVQAEYVQAGTAATTCKVMVEVEYQRHNRVAE